MSRVFMIILEPHTSYVTYCHKTSSTALDNAHMDFPGLIR